MAGDFLAGYAFTPDSGHSSALDVATDAAGNTYIAGGLSTSNTNQACGPIDLDPNPNAVASVQAGVGARTTFVVKYDAQGQFQWVRSMTEGSGDGISEIEVGPSGTVYFAGSFNNEFTLSGVTISTGSADPYDEDQLVGAFDTDGNLLWMNKVDNQAYIQRTHDLAVDESRGRLFLSGTLMRTSPGRVEASVTGCSFNTTGATRLWASTTYISTTTWNHLMAMHDIAIDGAGNPISVGQFCGTADFDPGAGKLALSSGSGRFDVPSAGYVWKLNGANGSLGWAKTFTPASGSNSNAIAVAADAAGNVYVGGGFDGTVDLDPGKGTFKASSVASGFLIKLNSAGAFSYATLCPNGVIADMTLVTIDDVQSIYAVGNSSFVTKFDASTGVQSASAFISGGSGYHVAVSPTGKINIVGGFIGTLSGESDPEALLSSSREAMFWLVLVGL